MMPLAIRVMAGGSGREIVRMPLGADAERHYGAPFWTIHRGDLQAALANAAQTALDVTLKLGTRVDDFAVHGNGITVQSRRGSQTVDERSIALIGFSNSIATSYSGLLPFAYAPICTRSSTSRYSASSRTI